MATDSLTAGVFGGVVGLCFMVLVYVLWRALVAQYRVQQESQAAADVDRWEGLVQTIADDMLKENHHANTTNHNISEPNSIETMMMMVHNLHHIKEEEAPSSSSSNCSSSDEEEKEKEQSNNTEEPDAVDQNVKQWLEEFSLLDGDEKEVEVVDDNILSRPSSSISLCSLNSKDYSLSAMSSYAYSISSVSSSASLTS